MLEPGLPAVLIGQVVADTGLPPVAGYFEGMLQTALGFAQAHRAMLWWLAALSVLLFIATLILVPILVVRIPPDYFAHKRARPLLWAAHHPVIRLLLLFGKNLVGLLLVVAGLAMLVLPGQGMLTLLVGIALLDFPGKWRLERWVVTRPPVLRSINWLRQRRGHPPLRGGDPGETPDSHPRR